MDIEQFYAEDERRRRSAEVELGTEWKDADGARYELSWVADTGELYVMREPSGAMTEDPFGDVWRIHIPLDQIAVAVIGWIPEQQTLEQVFEGWQDAMAQPTSTTWINERLREHDIPREPTSI